ncbi:lipopolysaccharide biosynthesis protein (SAM-dependent methyltransferase protein) [alpha proteobacterium BAL199]|jgi:FkbM family methyltransferase|nr:lipopolysaccharide biosynthesis protein (SAM-dependent methyltransferase protein) [alpha proteobacterium BAL199]
MFTFKSRDEARRKAVEDPADFAALFGSRWPPYSRTELAALPKVIRRGMVTPDEPYSRHCTRRLTRILHALQHRMARYGKTQTWAMTAPNGQKILFPINDFGSIEFKKMVDEYDQFYEWTLIEFVAARLGFGDVFVDVGANVGYISAFAATTGASVFAMEIQRDLIPLIEQTATINGFDQMRAMHVGASTRSGMSMIQRMEATPGNRLDDQTVQASREDPRSVIDDFVPMMALDDLFLAPHLLPRVVKIDVEGHEIGVLEGARRIIAAGRTTFVVEFHPHLIGIYRRRADELLAPFDRDRWSIFQLTDDGLRPLANMTEVRPDTRDPNPKLVFEPRPS